MDVANRPLCRKLRADDYAHPFDGGLARVWVLSCSPPWRRAFLLPVSSGPYKTNGSTAVMTPVSALGIKIAVFGNAGGGKSRLARRLAEATNLPLYCLDMIQFRAGRYWPEERGGGKIPDDEYLKIHADIIKRDEWSCRQVTPAWHAAWENAVAKTLANIETPILTALQVGQLPTCQGLFEIRRLARK